MRRLLTSAALASLLVLGGLATGPAADESKFVPVGPPRPDSTLNPQTETQALSLVRDHLPELAPVLDRLKVTNPTEYRKAIGELATEAKNLANVRSRNPARADLALDAWKARTQVELVAAQLASNPSAEREAELRAAIKARFDVDIRRHRFEVEQNEAAVVKAREHLAQTEVNLGRAREALTRIEKNREVKIENRFKALLPKKKPAPPAVAKTKTQPVAHTVTSTPTPSTIPSSSAQGKAQ